VRTPSLLFTNLERPGCYAGTQTGWTVLTAAAVALAVLTSCYGLDLGKATEAIKWSCVGVAGFGGLGLMTTHLFWKRVTPPNPPGAPLPKTPTPTPSPAPIEQKAPTPPPAPTLEQKVPTPPPAPKKSHTPLTLNSKAPVQEKSLLPPPLTYDKKTKEMLAKLYKDSEVKSKNPDITASHYDFIPPEKFYVTDKKVTPLFRFPTTLPAYFGNRYASDKQEAFMPQMEALDQKYVIQYIEGDGDCFFTSQVAGYLHYVVALLIEDSEKGRASLAELIEKIQTADLGDDLRFNFNDSEYSINRARIIEILRNLHDSDFVSGDSIREMLLDWNFMKNFTAFLRLYCYRQNGIEENVVKCGFGTEPVGSDYMEAIGYFFSMSYLAESTLSYLQEGLPAEDCFSDAMKELFIPEASEGYAVFAHGDHFDLLIPRPIMEVIHRRALELPAAHPFGDE
jgi:hypothetical protein